MQYTYTYAILLSQKKRTQFALVATWMDLEGLMLSEISQEEKDKYYALSFICRI